MNYIQHLNAVFQRFSKDSHLKASNISLYMALFQVWNMSRFPEVLYINRQEVMKMSKIGSLTTYHKGLQYLHDRRYIRYFPSHNPLVGSRVKILVFKGRQLGKKCTTNDTTTVITNGPLEEQVLVPLLNNNKHYQTFEKRPKSEKIVLEFFRSKKWSSVEARKFYNHYKSTGWKVGGKTDMQDWKAAAEGWILRAGERKSSSSSHPENLKTSKFKDYGEPL